MADITVTAASVIAAATANIKHGIAGAAITAGQSVYLDAATNTIKLADNDAVSADMSDAVGVAANNAAIGQPVSYIKDGPYNSGATLVKGTTYVVSSTAGGIAPQADLTSGDRVVIIGVALDTASIQIGLRNPGVTL